MISTLVDLVKKNKNLFIGLAVLTVLIYFDAQDVWAAGSSTSSGNTSVIYKVRTRAVVVIEHVKAIAYIMGGFGLIGLAWGAIFGKLNWKWFGSLAIGLFIMAWMGHTIDYFTGKDRNVAPQFNTTSLEDVCGQADCFGDTLKASPSGGTTQSSDTQTDQPSVDSPTNQNTDNGGANANNGNGGNTGNSGGNDNNGNTGNSGGNDNNGNTGNTGNGGNGNSGNRVNNYECDNLVGNCLGDGNRVNYDKGWCEARSVTCEVCDGTIDTNYGRITNYCTDCEKHGCTNSASD